MHVPAAGGAPAKAIGLLISTQPRDRLWLAIRTLRIEARDDYRESRLAVADGSEIWFGYLKLPLFFGQRYWLTRASDNHALAQATGNRDWEHCWRLVEGGKLQVEQAVRAGQVPGIGADDIRGAVYLSANRGSWVVIALPGERTLLIYQVATAIGGIIPDELVARYALFRVGQLLGDIEKQASTIQRRYTRDHPPVLGGDGRELPRFGDPSR